MYAPNNMDQITDKIWLGNAKSARNVKDLKANGISKVLSIMSNPPYIYKETDNILLKYIEIYDKPRENIIQYFGECLNFIEGNEKVLVHCIFGKSRSACIVIAYLIWKEKKSLDESLNFVNQRRRMAIPNIGFQKQLIMFEELLKENKYDLNKIKFKNIEWNYKC